MSYFFVPVKKAAACLIASSSACIAWEGVALTVNNFV